MFRDGLLAGKRILVTGGGSGLGREIAAKYLALGAELHLCGRREPVLRETAAAQVKLGAERKVLRRDLAAEPRAAASRCCGRPRPR